jgi:transposase
MKSYSVDFRQKIIDVYHNEPLCQKAIAERFCVALSFVQKLIKQYRLTQNIAPQTYRCGGQLKLNPEQLLVLTELIEAIMMPLSKNSVIYSTKKLVLPSVEPQWEE